MTVKPDNNAAVEFLYRWAPLGPWVLTAIQTDRKAIETKTFKPADEKSLVRWLDDYNGRRNIYFSVNPPIHDLSQKAEREEILAVAWLHIDIDPRAGEDIPAEQKRALGLLTTNLPKGVPSPTVIINSGGGVQGFWKLEEPIPVNGDLALAEDAKRYNQQLEVLFGGDACHNIDRIMRLPGTVNLPDARKVKKGRIPALAALVEFDESRVYPLSVFTAAPAVQMPGIDGFGGGAGTPLVQVSGNIERLNDVNDLDQWGVPDRVKIVIVQGKHPDEPKKGDNSRSSWVFDVCCNLSRFNVPDNVIFSVLTDPGFGISESVLEKGVNAERYALRQMERAKEEAVDPWLRELNERHAVIGNLGGKCRVVEEVMDQALRRTRLTRQSFDDFRNRYMNKQIQIGMTPQGMPMMSPVGKWWLNHPQRRQFDTIVFAPGHEVKGAYNMWKGFSCTSRPGNCDLFMKHVADNVCQGDPVLFRYLIGWMARCVQQPDSPGEVAVVLRGGRGTGKSFFAKQLGALFGRHFLHVSNPSHLVGNFNAHLRDVVLLFADEAFYAGDKKHGSILKTLITEETIQIEAKGVDVESAPNFVHLIMASNDAHVIPAGGDERRFLMLDVGQAAQQNAPYFKAIKEQMEAGGREALLHFLLTYDLSNYEVRDVPATEALREQKLLSLGVEEEWWYQKLTEARVLQRQQDWDPSVRKDALVDDYIEYTRRFNVSRRGNATALGRFLSRVCPKLDVVQQWADWEEPSADGFLRKRSGRAYFWKLPSLEVARARWESLNGPEKWADALQGELRQDDVPGGVPF